MGRKQYQLLDIDDGALSLFDQDGTTRDDVKVPDNYVGKGLQEAFDNGFELIVTVVDGQVITFQQRSPNGDL